MVRIIVTMGLPLVPISRAIAGSEKPVLSRRLFPDEMESPCSTEGWLSHQPLTVLPRQDLLTLTPGRGACTLWLNTRKRHPIK